MTLATSKQTRDAVLAELSDSVFDWLLDHALDRFADEVLAGRTDQAIDPEELSDFVEDAIRADHNLELADVLLRACRLADWEAVATWTLEALDGPDDEESDSDDKGMGLKHTLGKGAPFHRPLEEEDPGRV